ncbi:substrate-binding periplasmic protein [Pseudoalteromonas denitrificans]|uniref:Extracellular solute-binding protein, family 3 n=1 Tax=Pseudoalteromonas denitrificans DSM 6059 TaxID=1123010 RepID=A0A1I1SBS1_9GAMM|nr:transporter substrate-binding domain-containing protein [Pseudoalteromonas denitrificans]SFD41293.1 extracellular solute-binding protein, family 3 [Pseudoalteromonas denitrificans DSM 6059]
MFISHFKYYFLLCLCSFIYSANSSEREKQLHFLTEHLPPYQYAYKQKVVGGFTVELVQAALKLTRFKGKFSVYPWPRAFKEAQTQPNTFIFVIIRSKKREPLFKWVAHLIDYRYYLFGLSNRDDLNPLSLEDAKKYKLIATREGYDAQFLLAKGFKLNSNLMLSTSIQDKWNMLLKGRADLVMSNDWVAAEHLESYGIKQDKLDILTQVKEAKIEGYLGASLNTPDETIIKLREAISQLKKNGEYDKLINKYASELIIPNKKQINIKVQ